MSDIIDHPLANAKYLLRWRYDFIAYNSKYGQWDREASIMTDMAAFNQKPGLIRASIEGKDIRTREIKTLAEVDGFDFCLFQWMAIASSSGSGIKSSYQMVKKNIGLKLVTRNHFIEVYKSGVTKKILRTEEDKKFHFEQYGR